MLAKIKAFFRFAVDILGNIFAREQIALVSEGFDWVIHEECLTVKKYLESRNLANVRVTTTPLGLRNKIVHFFSENTLMGPNGLRHRKESNIFILSWFHISETDNDRAKHIPLLDQEISFLHTASKITESKLISYGMSPEKIILVGLDVDLNIFSPAKADDKRSLRKKLGLPQDKFLIGSFQKDGNGWGRGLEPKLIKGPDIFCDAVEKLFKKFPIHVVLTGPARGYVKNRLEKSGISYTYRYLEKYDQVADYFRAIDLYLVTSREEGGPKSILESMASGIPIISTKVGMAPDVIKNGTNGFLTEIGDVDVIVATTEKILSDENLRDTLIKNGLVTASEFSSEQMVQQLYEKIYKQVLPQSKHF